MAVVQHEMAVARKDVIELEDDVENVPTQGEVIKLCEVLEKVCLSYGDVDLSLELPHQLCKYRAKLQQDALLDFTQTSLDSYFTHTQRSSSMVDMEYT